MKQIKPIITAAIYSFLLPASADVLLAFWDFNDEDPISNNNTNILNANAGQQSQTSTLTFIHEAGSPETFQIEEDQGTTVNDIYNNPATAGNAIRLSRGMRWNFGHVTALFDGTNVLEPVTFSFAANLLDSSFSEYQAQYSIDGGDTFIDVGSVTSFPVGWTVVSIDFGTVFSGIEDAMIRLDFSGGTTQWTNNHAVRLDNFAITAIPEPGTLALVGIALGSLLLFRRKS